MGCCSVAGAGSSEVHSQCRPVECHIVVVVVAEIVGFCDNIKLDSFEAESIMFHFRGLNLRQCTMVQDPDVQGILLFT